MLYLNNAYNGSRNESTLYCSNWHRYWPSWTSRYYDTTCSRMPHFLTRLFIPLDIWICAIHTLICSSAMINRFFLFLLCVTGYIVVQRIMRVVARKYCLAYKVFIIRFWKQVAEWNMFNIRIVKSNYCFISGESFFTCRNVIILLRLQRNVEMIYGAMCHKPNALIEITKNWKHLVLKYSCFLLASW